MTGCDAGDLTIAPTRGVCNPSSVIRTPLLPPGPVSLGTRYPPPMARITLVLVAALTLISCTEETPQGTATTTTAPTELLTFESQELGFSIGYPAGWAAAENIEQGLFEATAPESVDGFLPNFNVVVNELPAEIPASTFFEAKVAEYRDALPDVEILEVANLSLDDGPARGITLTSTEAGSTIAISTLIVVNENNRVWEVSFFSAALTMERLGPLVTEIFQTFDALE